jgi:hypothetical protein
MSARHDNTTLRSGQQQRRRNEKMAKEMLVDTRRVDLARHFLSDFATADEADPRELSERIQATVESFCDVAFNIPASPEGSTK